MRRQLHRFPNGSGADEDSCCGMASSIVPPACWPAHRRSCRIRSRRWAERLVPLAHHETMRHRSSYTISRRRGPLAGAERLSRPAQTSLDKSGMACAIAAQRAFARTADVAAVPRPCVQTSPEDRGAGVVRRWYVRGVGRKGPRPPGRADHVGERREQALFTGKDDSAGSRRNRSVAPGSAGQSGEWREETGSSFYG